MVQHNLPGVPNRWSISSWHMSPWFLPQTSNIPQMTIKNVVFKPTHSPPCDLYHFHQTYIVFSCSCSTSIWSPKSGTQRKVVGVRENLKLDCGHFQCWLILTHRLKINVDFQFNSRWEPASENWWWKHPWNPIENSHLPSNLRIRPVFAFREGSSSHGEKIKNKY
jgi:hypothetical protein